MSSPILDMENINMRLGPSKMGRCGNGRSVHFGGVTMHPLTVGHPKPKPVITGLSGGYGVSNWKA